MILRGQPPSLQKYHDIPKWGGDVGELPEVTEFDSLKGDVTYARPL